MLRELALVSQCLPARALASVAHVHTHIRDHETVCANLLMLIYPAYTHAAPRTTVR